MKVVGCGGGQLTNLCTITTICACIHSYIGEDCLKMIQSDYIYSIDPIQIQCGNDTIETDEDIAI